MSVDAPARKRAAIADREAREFLRKADPVLARLIDARPDFRPRAWMGWVGPAQVGPARWVVLTDRCANRDVIVKHPATLSLRLP
jgi:hypothetical protein